MSIKAIQKALRRLPFEPFTIRLADGRELPLPHPEQDDFKKCMTFIGRRTKLCVFGADPALERDAFKYRGARGNCRDNRRSAADFAKRTREPKGRK